MPGCAVRGMLRRGQRLVGTGQRGVGTASGSQQNTEFGDWCAVYINLARRGDRRANLARTLSAANSYLLTRIERIEAVDGQHISLEDDDLNYDAAFVMALDVRVIFKLYSLWLILSFVLGLESNDCSNIWPPDGELKAAQGRAWTKADRPLHELIQAIISNGVNMPTEYVVLYAIRDRQLYRRLFRSRWYRDKEYLQKRLDFEADVRRVEALLWDALERFPDAPDADIVLLVQDDASLDPGPTAAEFCADFPCFTFSVQRTGPSEFIGFPNPYFICHMGREARHVQWQDKVSKAFWIGSLSCPRSKAGDNTSSWTQLPRVRLAKLAQEHKADLDIGFVGLDLSTTRLRFSKGKEEFLRRVYESAPKSRLRDLFQEGPSFRYLLNVDGVSVSWRGADLLAAESVMLLQDSDRGEFFYRDLKPEVEYVPMARDLSDLLPLLEHLRTEDHKARAIAEAGFTFRQQRLSQEAVLCWILQALQFSAAVRKELVPSNALKMDYSFQAVSRSEDLSVARCSMQPQGMNMSELVRLRWLPPAPPEVAEGAPIPGDSQRPSTWPEPATRAEQGLGSGSKLSETSNSPSVQTSAASSTNADAKHQQRVPESPSMTSPSAAARAAVKASPGKAAELEILNAAGINIEIFWEQAVAALGAIRLVSLKPGQRHFLSAAPGQLFLARQVDGTQVSDFLMPAGPGKKVFRVTSAPTAEPTARNLKAEAEHGTCRRKTGAECTEN